MATVTKKTRKPQPRSMQYYPATRLLFITEGKKATGYTVEETTHLHNADEHVRSFQLTKPDGTTYDVLLDGPGSSCDCIGFEHRGMDIQGGKGCKHIAALSKLVALGKLTAPQAKPEAPKQPANREPWCEYCNDAPGVYCEHCSI